MGLFDSLPNGSQVKLWGCNMKTFEVGDAVPDFGLPIYIIILREGGFVSVEDGKIMEIREDGFRYFPEDFMGVPCFDKWGKRLDTYTEMDGIFGFDEYFDEHVKSFVSKDRIDPWRGRVPKQFPFPFPIPTTSDGVFAKCPKCNRIKSLRVCYGCQEIMCENCLTEHQIACLRKDEDEILDIRSD